MGFKGNGVFGAILSFLMISLSPIPQILLMPPKTYENDRVYCGMLLTHLDPNVKYTVLGWPKSFRALRKMMGRHIMLYEKLTISQGILWKII
jgi:hypothetical protein